MALSVLALPAGADLNVSGHTRGGMEFTGRLAGTGDRMLHILPPENPEISLLGIPTESLESLTVPFPDSPSARFQDELERLLPLLPFWDRSSRESLLAWADSLQALDDWPRLYLWTSHLADSAPEDGLRHRALLLKARALYELGLFIQLDKELERINRAFSPLEAPLLLCWLNAHRARDHGDDQQARFWARLPALRIPVASGPLAEQLREFAPSPAAPPASPSPQPSSIRSAP
ncbi:MAG: hypothetical protein R6V45_01875 [Oceanipulchritudo sp.]